MGAPQITGPNLPGHSPKWWRQHPEEAAIAAASSEANQIKMLKQKPTKSEKINEILNITSFALALASWGYAVIAPDSNALFGSGLLLMAVLVFLAAVWRAWNPKRLTMALITICVLVGFGVFDWYVVLQPYKGKQFKSLLVEGYHISDECSVLPARDEMPEWIREQSSKWQTQTASAIADKLSYRDIQMWRGSGVAGLVKDKNVNAYQCVFLANKISTLENIIAQHFDSQLQHIDYRGPVYWFDTQNGKVDITEALKGAGNSANIYINSNGDPNPVHVTATVPTQPSSGP
ncbi:MAG TPA: hypothetical protein VF753_16700 [Terriglobales bacterium]